MSRHSASIHLRIGTATGYLPMHGNFGVIPARRTASSGGRAGEEVSPLGELVQRPEWRAIRRKSLPSRKRGRRRFMLLFQDTDQAGEECTGREIQLHHQWQYGWRIRPGSISLKLGQVRGHDLYRQSAREGLSEEPRTGHDENRPEMKSYNPDKTWTPAKE